MSAVKFNKIPSSLFPYAKSKLKRYPVGAERDLARSGKKWASI
jgi:hypothetical protein